MKNVYLYLLVIIGCASCSKNNENTNGGEELVLTAAEQQRVEADNKFTLKLLKELGGAPTDSNLLFSPLSISMAIAMTSNGTKGQTLEEIRTAMEFSGSTEEEINSYYKKLLSKLPVLDPAVNLKIANSIWYRNGFTPIPAFLQTNRDNYKATVEALDFNNPSVLDKINSWVNNNTNGKIPTILDEPISPDVVMYLINAVYFKSSWKYQFDKTKTTKAVFYSTGSGQVQADFMATKAKFKTAWFADGTVLELPYGNDKYSMLIFLPPSGKTVQDVISIADLTKWNTWTGNLVEKDIQVYLPKFKFSYGIKLNDVLVYLGMKRAFSFLADFTRLNADGGLYISKVMHKTFIDVNEEGTEAAAATAVEIGKYSSGGSDAITINRPFLFAIREMKTGLILFNGVVNNPLK